MVFMLRSATFLLACLVLLYAVHAQYSITDMNISLLNGMPRVYVECYDASGNPSSGTVNLTLYDWETEPKTQIGSSLINVHCNTIQSFSLSQPLSPGKYAVLAEISSSCDPSGTCRLIRFFVVPRDIGGVNIDEFPPSFIILVAFGILAIIRRKP